VRIPTLREVVPDAARFDSLLEKMAGDALASGCGDEIVRVGEAEDLRERVC
jgi:hypothetical protein